MPDPVSPLTGRRALWTRSQRRAPLTRRLVALVTAATLTTAFVGCADPNDPATPSMSLESAAVAAAPSGIMPINCLDPMDVPTPSAPAQGESHRIGINVAFGLADIFAYLISKESNKEAFVQKARDRLQYCFPGYNVVIAQPHDGSTQHMTGVAFVTTVSLSDTDYRAYAFKSGVFHQAGDLGFKNWAYSGYFTKSSDGATVTFTTPPVPARISGWTDGSQSCEVTLRNWPDRTMYYGFVDPLNPEKQGRYTRMLLDDLRACFPDYNVVVMHDEQPYEWVTQPTGVVWAKSYTMQSDVAAGESTAVRAFGPGLGGRGHFDVYVFKTGAFHNKGDGSFANWAYYGNWTRSSDNMTVTFSEPAIANLASDPTDGQADVDFGSDTPQFTSGTYPGCNYSGSVPGDRATRIQSLVTEYQRCFPDTNILVVHSVKQFSFGYLSALRHLATVSGESIFALDRGIVVNHGDGGWINWGFSGIFQRDGESYVSFTRPGQNPFDNGGVGNPMEQHPGGDDGGARPGASGECRPDGLVPTAGVATPYCTVYQSDGREWMGGGRQRRVVAYFNSYRTGADGLPHYLVKNIPWSKVTHINYAFATVDGNRISIGANGTSNPAIGMEWGGEPGAEMDTSLPYKGHFNLLTKYKRLHPRVKTLISVGGWAGSAGFYAMTTNADGTVNQGGINTFASSVVDFLRTYGFNGVDIDFEYPTVLDDSGNPSDWGLSNPRRKGLPDGYTALMKTLRENLDRAAAADGKYYLLTSASSASGYLVRGEANQQALRYQDFTNLMAYDYHGTWNEVVGPNAAIYDDHKDPELSDLYTTPEYGGIGYFNTDWAMRYMRGAMAAGRINIGVPYYTRGWKSVTGGTNGMWGKSQKTGCEPGTGIKRPCGDGAVGIDNIWHDDTSNGGELGSGTNPLWHAQNLKRNIFPNYAPYVGLSPRTDTADIMSGTYAAFWDATTRTAWLWNASKQVFLSTEEEQSVDEIVNLVRSTGAGGVMMWELGGDFACPSTVDSDHPCGMGYTLTTKLSAGMGASGPYDTNRMAGSSVTTAPTQTANITVELVNYPNTTANLWPLTPIVRLTNNTGVTLGGGKDTVLSFDIPASAPPLIKDANWQTGDQGGQWKVAKGNMFHRISTTLDYCQIIPAGKTLDLPIIYYLPITGPANTTLSVGGGSFAPVTDNWRGLPSRTPAAGGCNAANFDATKVYDPSTMPIEQTTVKYNGKVWKAKWWTQTAIPGTGINADNEPWKMIGPAS